MAPPPRHSEPDAPSEPSRKETLAEHEHEHDHEQEHGNRCNHQQGGNMKYRANPQIDIVEDHSGWFLKEGTVGSIPTDNTNCHRAECTAIEKRGEVKPDVLEVSNNDWNSAVHGAVSWAIHNPDAAAGLAQVPDGLAAELAAKEAGGDAQGVPAKEDELDEAKIEEMVKTYYDEHPAEKADVLKALGKVVQEQQATGNTESMEELIQNALAAGNAEIPKPEHHADGSESMKGVDKNDEYDGNAIPRHAKRAPIDLEDWRDDGEDELDVKFSQRLGESGKGKHHKDGKHHKGGKEHRSTSHHMPSTMHHSSGHEQTTAVQSSSAPDAAESVHTRSYSAPPRAPGHALPSSRAGGYKFTPAGGPAAETVTATPTVSHKGHAYGAKPTHTAAISGKTTAAPTKHVVELTSTVAHPQATEAANSIASAPAAHTASPAKHIANHREPVIDDYRAYDKINGATLNSVTPDSTTAQLLADSEMAATELNHGLAKSNQGQHGAGGRQFEKRRLISLDTSKPLKGKKLREHHRAVKKAQEEEMYGVVGQQAPVISSEELAKIQAAQANRGWAGWKKLVISFKSAKVVEQKGAEIDRPEWKEVTWGFGRGGKHEEAKEKKEHDSSILKVVPSKSEHRGPKAGIWDADNDNDNLQAFNMNVDEAGEEKGNKLGKRHSHIPQVKEEEDAKMRGYASSRHLSGAAAKKDRQKAAESVKEIAKNLEEDREAAQYAAEHRAEKMMEKAEKVAGLLAKAGSGKAKAKAKAAEYLDHDTYDPIKAHAAEDEEEAMEEDMREGAWTDVQGGELVGHSQHDHGSDFATYQLGSASATGLPNRIGAGMVNKAGEMSNLAMVMVIGTWIAILFAILKLARRKTEGEAGWLKGRRRGGRVDAQFLEDMEEGVEKRYD